MRAARLLSLVLPLQNRGRLTAGELAAELGVSVRTVYRDIDSLSGAGIPVYGEAGQGGGYQLLGGYRTRLTGLHADRRRQQHPRLGPHLVTGVEAPQPVRRDPFLDQRGVGREEQGADDGRPQMGAVDPGRGAPPQASHGGSPRAGCRTGDIAPDPQGPPVEAATYRPGRSGGLPAPVVVQLWQRPTADGRAAASAPGRWPWPPARSLPLIAGGRTMRAGCTGPVRWPGTVAVASGPRPVMAGVSAGASLSSGHSEGSSRSRSAKPAGPLAAGLPERQLTQAQQLDVGGVGPARRCGGRRAGSAPPAGR